MINRSTKYYLSNRLHLNNWLSDISCSKFVLHICYSCMNNTIQEAQTLHFAREIFRKIYNKATFPS